ncbi:MAG: hypothetical protein WBV22_04215 [Anaerolineaceae bacterium]
MMTVSSEKDWLLLSRYLAGALSNRQVEALESRLSSESDLTDALLQLKRTKSLLALLSQKPVPHNFTLSPKSLPNKQNTRLFPAFRLATAICSILFVFTIAFRVFALPMQSNQKLMMVVPEESQRAAPKASISSEDTASATAVADLGAPPLLGAGAPSTSLPAQEITREEAYVEEPVTPQRTHIPWVQIVWILGGFSLALGAAAVFFYFQERV